MDAFTYAELFVGLLSAVGAGILMVVATSRSPKILRDEIARRVERSAALLDRCKDATTTR
ncbi:MAG: hypothetical protein EOP82_29790 [Variovorax sp.]|nr:MAG: hypothetical protein EOP82_29790 [Variovorax sp.]